jgi:aquaporin TIP
MCMVGKLMPDVASDASSLVVVAVTNAFALSSAVYVAANISGGHVNPAVTFGMAVGGHISVPTALFYWVSQMLASVMASLLLKMTVVGQVKHSSNNGFFFKKKKIVLVVRRNVFMFLY